MFTKRFMVHIAFEVWKHISIAVHIVSVTFHICVKHTSRCVAPVEINTYNTSTFHLVMDQRDVHISLKSIKSTIVGRGYGFPFRWRGPPLVELFNHRS